MKRAWFTQMSAMILLMSIGIHACEQVIVESPADSVDGEGVILPDGTEFTRAALLEALGNCIISEIEVFKDRSLAFANVAAATVADSDQHQAAQQAWRDAIDTWQQLEVMQIGPAGRTTQPGGQGWRDSIYAWPLESSCSIDNYLVSEMYSTDMSAIKVSANGLWTAEYLLFYQGDESSCGPDDEINTSGAWDALDENTLLSRRAQYTAFVADTIKQSATALLNAWSPEGENFLAEFTQAGQGSRTYGKTRVALNAISDALAYVEWATKDRKLARPLGLDHCDQETCSDLVESKYARHSKEHLRNNLLGFRKLFMGCGVDNSGLGIDDLLYAVGQPELAAKIDREASATLNAIDNIDEADLVTALEEDLSSVSEVHSALGRLTDLLRTDLLIVLSLELPQMVQGDND